MIVYNVTTQPAWEIHEEWLNWMKEVHIPDVMATGMFSGYRMLRMLDVDQPDGPTYTVQYFSQSRDYYEHYLANFAKELREKGIDKWGDRLIAFRSLMEVVE